MLQLEIRCLSVFVEWTRSRVIVSLLFVELSYEQWSQILVTSQSLVRRNERLEWEKEAENEAYRDRALFFVDNDFTTCNLLDTICNVNFDLSQDLYSYFCNFVLFSIGSQLERQRIGSVKLLKLLKLPLIEQVSFESRTTNANKYYANYKFP